MMARRLGLLVAPRALGLKNEESTQKGEKCESQSGKTGLQVSGCAVVYCHFLESDEALREGGRRERGDDVSTETHGIRRHECSWGIMECPKLVKEQASGLHGVTGVVGTWEARNEESSRVKSERRHAIHLTPMSIFSPTSSDYRWNNVRVIQRVFI